MKIKYLILLTLFTSLMACNQDDEIKSQQPAYERTASGFIGKPRAPVTMRYEYMNQAVLNEKLDIKLIFKVKRNTENLRVRYKTTALLKSADASQQFEFSRLANAEEVSFVIQVVPEKAGLHYVNVSSKMLLDGAVQARSFAIPVKVSAINSATGISLDSPEQKTSTDNTNYLPEQNVISMPAVELDSPPAEQ